MIAIDIAMQQRSYIAPQQLYKFFLQLICKLAGNEFAGRSNPARGKGTDLYRLDHRFHGTGAMRAIPEVGAALYPDA